MLTVHLVLAKPVRKSALDPTSVLPGEGRSALLSRCTRSTPARHRDPEALSFKGMSLMS